MNNMIELDAESILTDVNSRYDMELFQLMSEYAGEEFIIENGKVTMILVPVEV